MYALLNVLKIKHVISLNSVGICSVMGEADYVTFDGNMYSFFDMCMHTLLVLQNVEVNTQNIPCGPSGVICARKLNVHVGSLKIELAREIDLKVGGIVKPDGYYLYVHTH